MELMEVTLLWGMTRCRLV